MRKIMTSRDNYFWPKVSHNTEVDYAGVSNRIPKTERKSIQEKYFTKIKTGFLKKIIARKKNDNKSVRTQRNRYEYIAPAIRNSERHKVTCKITKVASITRPDLKKINSKKLKFKSTMTFRQPHKLKEDIEPMQKDDIIPNLRNRKSLIKKISLMRSQPIVRAQSIPKISKPGISHKWLKTKHSKKLKPRKSPVKASKSFD